MESRAKPKEDVDVDAPKIKRAPDIQWTKNPDWTYTLIAYLGDHVSFRLKLFSDSTADATKEGRPKLTAKDGKIQQYTVLAKHIFASEPGGVCACAHSNLDSLPSHLIFLISSSHLITPISSYRTYLIFHCTCL